MLEAHPYLLDAVVLCTAAELEEFERATRWIFEKREEFGTGGGKLSRLVVPPDRAALARHLVEQRSGSAQAQTRAMLKSILEVFSRSSSWTTAHGSRFLGRYALSVTLDEAPKERSMPSCNEVVRIRRNPASMLPLLRAIQAIQVIQVKANGHGSVSGTAVRNG